MNLTKKTIFYYVSSHGFGHATRSSEIIHQLNLIDPDIEVYIKTGADQRIFSDSECNFKYNHFIADVGVVQHDGLTMDIPQTIVTYREISRNYDNILISESAEASRLGITAVISDVPALVFRLSQSLGVPGIAISNFSWDWIYEPWQAEYPEIEPIIQELKKDYERADLLLKLPFAPAKLPAFRSCRDLPLVARKSNLDPDEVRSRLKIKTDKPIVLLSFGGMGLNSARLSSLESLREFCFLSIGNYGAPGIQLSNNDLRSQRLRYQDIVSAVDIVVSKPGYGIVSECAANKTRLLYTDRGSFREYDEIVPQMKNYLPVQYIPQSRFKEGLWKTELEELMNLPPAEMTADLSGAHQAAQIIKNIVGNTSHDISKNI